MKLCNYFPLLLIICLVAAILLTPGKASSSYHSNCTVKSEKSATKSLAVNNDAEDKSELLLRY